MRRIVDCAKTIIVTVASASLLISASLVSAQDSQVIVRVCDAAALGQIDIVSPESDTVLRQTPLVLEGQVQLVNQVEIYINGNYHKVQAVASGSNQFSTTVSLQPGTQTIEARGVGLCNGDEVQDQIVVTYEPPPNPVTAPDSSPGSRVPTVVSPTPSTSSSGGGVVVSNPDLSSPSDEGSAGWWAGLRDWLSGMGWGNRVFRLIDIDTTAERMSANWLRVAGFVIGLGLALGARLIAKDRQQLRRTLRVIGVVLLVASVLLVI